MIKNEMTRGRFAVLGVVVVLSLILFAWRGLVQSGEITVMMALVVVYSGILPFLIGFIVQWGFQKRVVPSYAAWVLALVMVVIQWKTSGKAPFTVMGREIISVVVSLIITGVFVNWGLSTSSALFKRKSELTGK